MNAREARIAARTAAAQRGTALKGGAKVPSERGSGQHPPAKTDAAASAAAKASPYAASRPSTKSPLAPPRAPNAPPPKTLQALKLLHLDHPSDGGGTASQTRSAAADQPSDADGAAYADGPGHGRNAISSGRAAPRPHTSPPAGSDVAAEAGSLPSIFAPERDDAGLPGVEMPGAIGPDAKRPVAMGAAVDVSHSQQPLSPEGGRSQVATSPPPGHTHAGHTPPPGCPPVSVATAASESERARARSAHRRRRLLNDEPPAEDSAVASMTHQLPGVPLGAAQPARPATAGAAPSCHPLVDELRASELRASERARDAEAAGGCRRPEAGTPTVQAAAVPAAVGVDATARATSEDLGGSGQLPPLSATASVLTSGSALSQMGEMVDEDDGDVSSGPWPPPPPPPVEVQSTTTRRRAAAPLATTTPLPPPRHHAAAASPSSPWEHSHSDLPAPLEQRDTPLPRRRQASGCHSSSSSQPGSLGSTVAGKSVS